MIFDSVRPLTTEAVAEGPDADSAEHTSWRASPADRLERGAVVVRPR